jgi:hypothetical protein
MIPDIPSSVAHQECGPEEVPLDCQGIDPCQASGRVDRPIDKVVLDGRTLVVLQEAYLPSHPSMLRGFAPNPILKQAKLIDRAGRGEFKSKETGDAKSDVRSHDFESAQPHSPSGDFTAQFVRGL